MVSQCPILRNSVLRLSFSPESFFRLTSVYFFLYVRPRTELLIRRLLSFVLFQITFDVFYLLFPLYMFVILFLRQSILICFITGQRKFFTNGDVLEL